MLVGITFLLIFQLIGEIISWYTGGAVPGSVIGLVLAALVLALAQWHAQLQTAQEKVVTTSNFLLVNLGLFFVPAGVGIIEHFDVIARYGAALVVTIILSTLATLAVTAGVFVAVKRLGGGRP
ncbi:MAG: LrgA family protein [Candidatus Tokpelaia hoelldobleri]|uniref:LrgA family protein n=1 Tax=Candidatus Tokpelaia hoelldobleri TaxID=1902579 RepID=A0A1U9JSU0_9HYPH|nr:MAG: LrgA family protein [Candidatus Tokpelaia hoelldoblerii]